MTNVMQKIDYQKLIEDFQVEEVIVDGDQITVWGENGIGALINKNNVIHYHPGADGYTATRDCDRGTHYHIPADELWDDGSDNGQPASMVGLVWDQVDKQWIDDDMDVVMEEKRYNHGRVVVWGFNPAALNSWDGQRCNHTDIQSLINKGFWVDKVEGDLIHCTLYDACEFMSVHDPFMYKITPFDGGVKAIFRKR